MNIILTKNQIKKLQSQINSNKTNDNIIEEIKFIKKVLFSYTNSSTQSEKDKLKFVNKYINEINRKLVIYNNLFEVTKNNIHINENTVKNKIKNSFKLIESRIINFGLIKEEGEVVTPITQINFGQQTIETVKTDSEIASDSDATEFWVKCGIPEPKIEDPREYSKQTSKCFTKIIRDNPSYQNSFQIGWNNLKKLGLLNSGTTAVSKYFGFKLKEKKEETEGSKPIEGNKFLNWIKKFKWSAFFEGLRNVLHSSGGQLIQRFLSSTGVGAIGVTAAWGVLTIYDIWCLIKGTIGNWYNLIIDIVSIVSGGWIGNKLSALKTMTSNKIDDVVKTISKNKYVRSIIKPLLKKITNLNGWLKSIMEWSKNKLNANWIGEADNGVSTVTTELSSKLETEIDKAEKEESTNNETMTPPPPPS